MIFIAGGEERTARSRAMLDRPLAPYISVISWFASIGLFVLVVQFFGGVALGDSAESTYATWSIAHLNIACAYSPMSHFAFPNAASPFASVAPLYPILSALLTGAFRIGHGVPFPSAEMGVHCSNAYVAMYKWSIHSGAWNPTLRVAYIGWIVVMVGVVVLLRASGRGRNGWEAVTLFLLAIVPSVWGCVATYFHPQDLIAMGCILLAVSSAVRAKWTLSGVLLGLAFASQQFALLAIAMMFVVVPRDRRLSFGAGTVASIVAVDLPFIVLTSGRAFKIALFGSSRLTLFGEGGFHAAGGTVLFATHARGVADFLISRTLPVACALAIAIWAVRRIGPRVTQIEILLSLLATEFCMRLIFEENLFGYYFMALTATLLCIDGLRGRLSGPVLVWIGMVVLAFDPIPWWLELRWEMRGVNLFMVLPVIFEVLVGVSFILGAVHRHFRWYLLASSMVVAATCFPPLWGRTWVPVLAPHWLWQIILVPTGLILASSGLRSATRNCQPLRTLEHGTHRTSKWWDMRIPT